MYAKLCRVHIFFTVGVTVQETDKSWSTVCYDSVWRTVASPPYDGNVWTSLSIKSISPKKEKSIRIIGMQKETRWRHNAFNERSSLSSERDRFFCLKSLIPRKNEGFFLRSCIFSAGETWEESPAFSQNQSKIADSCVKAQSRQFSYMLFRISCK